MTFLGIKSLPTTPEAIYGIVIGFAILLLLLCNLIMHIVVSLLSSSILCSRVRPFILKHIIYARSYYPFLGFGSFSRSRFILATFYYTGTAICNYIGVHTIEDAGKRAARLCVINLIPMFLGSGYEFGARLLGVSLRSYGFLHRLFASIVFLEATVHIIVQAQTRNIQAQIYGILAASTLLALVLLPLVKKRVYEIFHVTHIACAATLVYAIWQHCRSTKDRFWAFPLAYAIIFSVTGTLQLVRIIYRNVVLGRSHVRLNMEPYAGDVALIELSLPRPWTVYAGQRIHLAVPEVGIFYVFQTHPFAISWWDSDCKGRAVRISILFRPRSGFTRKLYDHSRTRKSYRAWIDGPFGPSSVGWKLKGKVGDYGHVFMVATGIGISAHLPYIKELLDGHDRAEVPTQRISLIWRLDQIGDWESARNLLQKLIEQDNGYMLRVIIYDTTESQAQTEVQHIGGRGLISVHFGPVDWKEQLDQEMKDCKGKLLVSVSAQNEVRQKIRGLVRPRVYRGVELFETEFQPWDQTGGVKSVLKA